MTTPPDFTAGAILTAAQMNSVGLWRVTGCTVTSAGGTAATASNGVITIGTGNTSITVNNAFSADFNRYKITIDGGTASTIADLQIKLGSTATGYYGFLTYGTYTSNTVQGFALNNGTNIGYAGAGSTNALFMDCELSNPFQTTRTTVTSRFAVAATTSSSAHFTGFVDNNTSYTAFTITPNTGSLTGGTIRVYGYRN